MICRVILNGRKVRESALKGIKQIPKDQIHPTSFHQHAIKLCEEFLDNTDYLIAIGGDGTFNEVIQVIGRRIESGQNIPKLALIPAGSANDFAKNLELPLNIEEALELKDQQAYAVDFGKIIRNDHINYFLNIADFGIGAEVVERVNKSSKMIHPGLRYLRAISLAFMKYKAYPIKVSWEGDSWEGDIAALTVANGCSFGSGLFVAPDAELRSGQFQLTRIEALSILEYMLNVLKLKKRNRLKHPKVFYHDSSWVEVETQDDRCALEADGEYFGPGSARFEVLPKALNMQCKS